MASRKKATTKTAAVAIAKLQKETATFYLVGTAPLMLHRLSQKTLWELLLPGGKKSAGAKKSTLKHDPYQEFLDAPHLDSDPDAPTLLLHPSTGFKNAIRSVAIDVDTASSKAQLGRLSYVLGEYVPIWGIPTMRMDAVRMRDAARTPDVRTRCCLREWASRIEVVYCKPMLSAQTMGILVANAGVIQGTGDGRVEKGSLNCGTWRVCNPDDADWLRITKEAGRKAQVDAMDDPEPYDDETRELYSWFEGEAARREFDFRKRRSAGGRKSG